MRRATWLLVIAGCTSSTPSEAPTDQEREVKRAFEAWKSHVVAGRVPDVFGGMSTMMVSEWLYQRIGDPEDAVMRKYRSQLAGAPSEDLDVWFVDNKRKNVERPAPLPASVLTQPWLFKCFAAYYEPLRERLKYEFSRVEVSHVYADASGATVVVKNSAFGGTDRYVMVYEDGWRVDHHKEPGALLPK